MANISQHKSTSVTKLLLVGDSGSGKTSALASLANAGKKLRILDYDDGLDILSEYLTPEAVSRVSYITLSLEKGHNYCPLGKTEKRTLVL